MKKIIDPYNEEDWGEEYRVVNEHSSICLYCGQKKKVHYEDYSPYRQCDCADAKKERKIQEEIRKLKSQLPRNKYKIEKQTILKKI